MLDRGAAGVRIGTRFVATVESGAHPSYKDAVVHAGGGDDTEITDAFAVCPLCATMPRARVLRSCITALHGLADADAGETMVGGSRVRVAKGHGMPPSESATG